jgi:hypothetical protein
MTTGEFVPLKEDDYIIRSEMHYVIESRKVSKDIKKLKERLKKGWTRSLSFSLSLSHTSHRVVAAGSRARVACALPYTEKPVWDSDNWPLMVDFVDSKVRTRPAEEEAPVAP